jgi:SPP1 family predicted phage head-tail adaptor
MLKSKEKIGRFDRRIFFLNPVEVSSTSGGPKYNGYEELDSDSNPYARWQNKTGTEVVEGDQITHIQQAKVTVRYRTDLTLKTKIVSNGKMYAILSFAESGETRQRFLDITAEYEKEFDWT